MSVRKECSKYEDCKFSTVSCFSSEFKTFNLKDYFNECLIEHRYGEFIPDLLLLPKDRTKDPIFIEIWNKHKNSEKKANSEYKIIEIKIQTLQELEELPKHPITESGTITFNHFNTTHIKPEDMKSHVELIRYTLYEKGTSYCGYSTKDKCYSYKKPFQKTAILSMVGRKLDFAYDTYFEDAKVAMRSFASHRIRLKGYEPKSCYDCCYRTVHGHNEATIITCKKNLSPIGEEMECTQDDALECKNFRINNYHKNEVLDRHRLDHIDIWEREPRTTEEDKLYICKTEEFLRYIAELKIDNN